MRKGEGREAKGKVKARGGGAERLLNLHLTAIYNITGPLPSLCSCVIVFYIFGSLCGFSSLLRGGHGVEREDAAIIDNEKLCDLSCAWTVLLIV